MRSSQTNPSKLNQKPTSSRSTRKIEQILQLEPVAAHVLVNKKKKLICLGKLKLFKNNGKIWITINNWNSQQLMENSRIQKLSYQKNLSYVFENIVAGFVSLTIPKTEKTIELFEDGFSKIGLIVEFQQRSDNQKLNRKINYHCPMIKEIPIHHQNFLTKFFKLGGKLQAFFGGRTLELHHTTSNNPDIQDRFNNYVFEKITSIKDKVFGKRNRDVMEKVEEEEMIVG